MKSEYVVRCLDSNCKHCKKIGIKHLIEKNGLIRFSKVKDFLGKNSASIHIIKYHIDFYL